MLRNVQDMCLKINQTHLREDLPLKTLPCIIETCNLHHGNKELFEDIRHIQEIFSLHPDQSFPIELSGCFYAWHGWEGSGNFFVSLTDRGQTVYRKLLWYAGYAIWITGYKIPSKGVSLSEQLQAKLIHTELLAASVWPEVLLILHMELWSQLQWGDSYFFSFVLCCRAKSLHQEPMGLFWELWLVHVATGGKEGFRDVQYTINYQPSQKC